MKSTVTDISKRLDLKPNKTEGIINYDIDNAYPQRVVDIINASSTGVSVTEKLTKFIFGQGFNDPNLAKFKVNKKGLTANELLRKVAVSLAKYNGFNIHCNYNANYEISSLNLSPFDFARFTTSDNEDHPNMLAIYNDWQKINKSKIDKDFIDYINFFDETKAEDQIQSVGGFHKYKGQILYWTTDGVEYPLAPGDSVLEDMQTDAKSKNFKFRNVSTNFMASHILEVDAFESDEARETFIDDLTSFQGDDNALQIFLLEKISGQEGTGFKMEKVDIQDIDKLYQYTEESVKDNITQKYGIPTVLMKSVAGKLGTSSEIKDAVAYYNGHTKDYRIAIEEQFAKLINIFSGANFTDFSIKEFEAPTVPIKDTVEGKDKILEIIKDEHLSANQKRYILLNDFKVDEDYINAVITESKELLVA